jgi:hypothetical protein
MWRVALLSVVFVTDLIVFIGLCREELRDWRGRHGARLSGRGAGKQLPAMVSR